MDKLWVCCSFDNEYELKLSMSLISKVSHLVQQHEISLEVIYLTQSNITTLPVNDMSALCVSILHIWRKECFDNVHIRNYVMALQMLIEKYLPRFFIFIGTSFYRNIAAQLATSMNVGLTAECTEFYLNEVNELIQVRPAFEGNTFAHIRSESDLIMATALPVVNSVVFKNNKQIDIQVDNINLPLPLRLPWSDYKENKSDEAKKNDLYNHSIVFAGGMGLKTKENFKKLQLLAKKYKVGLAASRPVVEMGWVDKSHLVGISGHCITPKVYVAFGISGMLQHIEGVNGATVIVSINTDKEAPIHNIANYIIYSDAVEIITHLLQGDEELSQ